MNSCFFFPDSGNQFPGMGKDFLDTSTIVRELFELASTTLHRDLQALLLNSTANELAVPVESMISTITMERACSACAREHAFFPRAAAGYGFGAWSAFAECGAMTESRLFETVKIMAELLGKAMEKGTSSFSSISIIADSKEIVADLENFKGVIHVAAVPGDNHIILTGRSGDIELAEKRFTREGVVTIKRTSAYPVFTPLASYFHDGLSEYLADFKAATPSIPLYLTESGVKCSEPDAIRASMIAWAVSPVMWASVMKNVHSDGYESILETGPGGSLATMYRGAYREPIVHPASSLDQIATISL